MKNLNDLRKRCAEHLCALYFKEYGLQTVIARCFSFVGRDLPKDVHFAIGNFINDAINSSEIIVTGDGSPVRSYLDQRDLAEWLTELLFLDIGGEAYNVGSDQTLTIEELAYKIRDLISPNKNL
jgi:UDP-glucuronate decarboxylase